MKRTSRAYRRRRKSSAEARTRPQQKRIFRGVLVMAALLLLIIFFFGDHGLYQLYRLRAERRQIQQEIELLRAERIGLEAEKQLLESDFEYIERLARERYRMAKPGEKVFKVIEKEQDSASRSGTR